MVLYPQQVSWSGTLCSTIHCWQPSALAQSAWHVASASVALLMSLQYSGFSVLPQACCLSVVQLPAILPMHASNVTHAR